MGRSSNPDGRKARATSLTNSPKSRSSTGTRAPNNPSGAARRMFRPVSPHTGEAETKLRAPPPVLFRGSTARPNGKYAPPKGEAGPDTHLTLRPTGKFGDKGELYEVIFEGEVILRSIEPVCKACRVLQSRGVSGRAHFWREGRAIWDIRMPISWGAQRSVRENKKEGPLFVNWKPFPAARTGAP
jgi:hypothetical protein